MAGKPKKNAYVLNRSMAMMPIALIWLGNIITAGARWKNTEYAVTDKRIIIRSGFVGYEYQNIYYKEISDVHLHVGLIDRMLHVGDIMICVPSHGNTKTHNLGIIDIENAEEIFKKVQKAIMDIQTDIEFPNAYRPNVNGSYKTNYRG